MAFPESQTLDELQQSGFVFSGVGNCKACGVRLAWFRTPRGKPMPFNRKGTDLPKRFEAHHVSCPKADQFRKTGS